MPRGTIAIATVAVGVVLMVGVPMYLTAHSPSVPSSSVTTTTTHTVAASSPTSSSTSPTVTTKVPQPAGLEFASNPNWKVTLATQGSGLATMQYATQPCRETECPFLQIYDLGRRQPPGITIVGGKLVDLDRCPGGDVAFGKATWKQSVVIGGKTAEYYESLPCPGYDRSRKLWYAPSCGVLILGLPASGTSQHVPVDEMDKLFGSATCK